MAGNTQNAATTISSFDSTSTIPLFLNGAQITTPRSFDVVSPIDGRVLYKCSSASEEDAAAAVAGAQNAFISWSKTKPAYRRDIFLRAAQIFEERKKELASYSHAETGALEMMVAHECNIAIEACMSIAGLIQAVQGSIPSSQMDGTTALILREPYGVVLGIAPWNAPYTLGTRACISALAMGNTVILKGPELAPATYWAIADVLHSAGLPAGCLNTIYHRSEDAASVTTALISHPLVKKINFTGSTKVGAIIASLAGKHLKPVLLELGGKAPAIICEHADIDNAASHCVMGAFVHGGQVCMSTERIIVHANVAVQFKEKLKAAIDNRFAGKATLINNASVRKNELLVKDALEKGATTVYGDANAIDNSCTTLSPIVLSDIQKGMDIYYNESFGPTVSLFTVESEEEALELANDTEYGLTSAIFTEDLRQAIRLARGLETGAVHINSMTIHDEAGLPHGGAKKSGYGRFNTLNGLEEWVRTKSVTWKD
ncbi:uncharacterized protein N7479_009933 [Penicillium vulpinum]|uniref:Aldehyde dehydrogenase domain-containing protein n=1 Tax=Penicillium vulpinum TaxID=29845 RepID=A0A1V6RXM0_9EURO|nr:uncharacterized protein N7479_009933 [Penicillium vulpinum]KAJ5951520.1 hypothetical protein N7479_009933 [Penicillium vulpinum]OQE06522.1 hypothetical protein PENVUL_c017G04750 [Penicillium vulpinum]